MFLVVFLNRVVEAFVNPRLSARRILKAAPTIGEAISMVLLSAIFSVIAEMLLTMLIAPAQSTVDAIASATGEAAGDGDATTAPPERLSGVALVVNVILLNFFQYLLISSLAYGIGKWAGGKATRPDILGVVAWYSLALTPAGALLIALMLMSTGEAPNPAISGLVVVVGFYALFVFAGFVAEAHGFESTWTVVFGIVGVIVGLMFAFVFLANILGVRMTP